MELLRLGAALAAIAAVLSGPALGAGGETDDRRPAVASTLTIAYELYIAGLALGHIDVSARIDGSSYRAQSTLDTKGLISIFWQAHIEAQSNGRLAPGAVRPALYGAYSTHSEKHQQVTVTYGPGGPASVVAEPPYSAKYPVTEIQRRNTVDPLSAMIHIAAGLSATAENPCGVGAPVYDGRRRYDIQLSYVKSRNISLDNGAYSGPALVCEIKYVQIAGFKQKILEEGKRLPRMFAWMVSMPSRANPSRHYLVPVRLWAETGWGTAVAVISRVQLDGFNVAYRR